MDLLKNKRLPWKQRMYAGLDAAYKKLSTYYKKTYESHGIIYAVAVILNPCAKLEFFKTDAWEPEPGAQSWSDFYRQKFEQVYHYYAKKFPSTASTPLAAPGLIGLNQLLSSSRRKYTKSESDTSSYKTTEWYRYLSTREF